MKNLLGHIKSPVEAGDHELVGLQVHPVVYFSPLALGNPKLRKADARRLALQHGGWAGQVPWEAQES